MSELEVCFRCAAPFHARRNPRAPGHRVGACCHAINGRCGLCGYRREPAPAPAPVRRRRRKAAA